MNLALEITLVVLVCIGVTYSAPPSVSGSDAGQTEKPPVNNPAAPVVEQVKVQTLPPSTTTIPPAQTVPVHTDANIPSTGNVIANVTTKDIPKEGNKTTTSVVDKNNTTLDSKNTTATGNATVTNTTNAVPPENKTTNGTVTPSSSTVKPTEVPITTIPPQKPTTTSATITTTKATTSSPINAQTTASEHAEPVPTAEGRQFDGPSFVGGIVLTVGLTAIGFIAFKFYKSGKIERNYRTL